MTGRTEATRSNEETRLYCYEPEQQTAPLQSHPGESAPQPSVDWGRMEALYSTGQGTCVLPPACHGSLSEQEATGEDGGVCEAPPASYAPPEGAAAPGVARDPDAPKASTTPAPQPGSSAPPETYEQCVNREAKDGSVQGRWMGAGAGCVTVALAVATATGPAAPALMGIGCAAGGVSGFLGGGSAGGDIGAADARVDCDRPDKPGSPSARALQEMKLPAPTEYGPIKG